jgi:hypothetical protein
MDSSEKKVHVGAKHREGIVAADLTAHIAAKARATASRSKRQAVHGGWTFHGSVVPAFPRRSLCGTLRSR